MENKKVLQIVRVEESLFIFGNRNLQRWCERKILIIIILWLFVYFKKEILMIIFEFFKLTVLIYVTYT